MAAKLKVCVVHFWPGFSLENGLLGHLIRRALGEIEVVDSEADADIVFASLFPRFARLGLISSRLKRGRPKFPAKTVCVLWENQRPDYRHYAYSISSDFDSYGGRNIRVPVWYGQLQWPGMSAEKPWDNKAAWTNYEPLIDVGRLLAPRPPEAWSGRDKFCCFVAKNPEPYRLLAIEALSRVGQVDLYGPISGKAFQGSKYELLSKYKFNLCFENSMFPGYYTEKLVQSWAGGCIPLYFSDLGFERDFNPNAAINSASFADLDAFAQFVSEVDRTPELARQIHGEPLIYEAPSLEPAVCFLARAGKAIMNGSRS